MNDKIVMHRLGVAGQWGNQVIQYAFLRTYARRFGLAYQCPPWAGQYFFGHDDPPVTDRLPDWEENYSDVKRERCFGTPVLPVGDELRGKDFRGWAQYHTSWYRPDREFIQGLYRPQGSELLRVKPALQQLRERGKTIISLHLRRGDSGRLIYFLTPMLWPLRWLHANWRRFDNPILFIATQDKGLVEHFAGYKPVTAEDLGIAFATKAPPNYAYPHAPAPDRASSMDFFPDWFLMQHSDVVLAAESTFSFSAAWVSTVVKEFWRPRLSLQGFERVDPWDTVVTPREHLDVFNAPPGIPGVQVDEPQHKGTWGAFRNKWPSVPEDPATWETFLEPQ